MSQRKPGPPPPAEGAQLARHLLGDITTTDGRLITVATPEMVVALAQVNVLLAIHDQLAKLVAQGEPQVRVVERPAAELVAEAVNQVIASPGDDVERARWSWPR